MPFVACPSTSEGTNPTWEQESRSSSISLASWEHPPVGAHRCAIARYNPVVKDELLWDQARHPQTLISSGSETEARRNSILKGIATPNEIRRQIRASGVA